MIRSNDAVSLPCSLHTTLVSPGTDKRAKLEGGVGRQFYTYKSIIIEGRESILLHYMYVLCYGGHDLCNDIHELEGSLFGPLQLQWCRSIYHACVHAKPWHATMCLKCKLQTSSL